MSEVTPQPEMSGFSEQELLDLGYLRQAYASGWTTEQQEVVADERRLEFARWMVEHGILNESGS